MKMLEELVAGEASGWLCPPALGSRWIRVVASERGVRSIELGLEAGARSRRVKGTAAGSSAGARRMLARAVEELEGYFEGQVRRFSVRPDFSGASPASAAGTRFQRRVWEALLAIPHGSLTSYGALAARLGMPGSGRAVGGAVGRNPVPVIVPCHRVIGTDGRLTGFSAGLDLKVLLLEIEGILPRGSGLPQARNSRISSATSSACSSWSR